MHFAEAARLSAAFTRTENGAVALNTTGDAPTGFLWDRRFTPHG